VGWQAHPAVPVKAAIMEAPVVGPVGSKHFREKGMLGELLFDLWLV